MKSEKLRRNLVLFRWYRVLKVIVKKCNFYSDWRILSPGVTCSELHLERITLSSLLDLDCRGQKERQRRPVGGCCEIWVTENGRGEETWSQPRWHHLWPAETRYSSSATKPWGDGGWKAMRFEGKSFEIQCRNRQSFVSEKKIITPA